MLGDSRLAKSLADQQQKANDAIDTLNQARQSLVVDRKSAALQKLELASIRLQLLRSLGGDPKLIARQAKQIAQEIAAAATEYGDAVSGGADASAPSGQPAEAPAAGEVAASATDAGAPDQADISAAPASDAAESTGAPAGVGTASAPSPDVKTAADKTTTLPASVDLKAARQKNVQVYQDAVAKRSALANKGEDDRENLEKFRAVADEAKRVIEDAARKLKLKSARDPDAAEAEHAKIGLDLAIQQLGDAIGAEQIDTAAADVVIAAPATEPAISITINVLA